MKRAEFAFSPPGRMLFRFAIDEAAMQARFGPPHYGANGPRGLPAWGFELEDGTSFELHFRAGDDTCYVNGDLRDIDYLVARLALADVVDRLDEDPTHYAIALEEHFPAWQMHRLVVDGAVVHETPSPREAAWRADQTGARIELEPEADARATRTHRLRAQRTPQAPPRAGTRGLHRGDLGGLARRRGRRALPRRGLRGAGEGRGARRVAGRRADRAARAVTKP